MTNSNLIPICYIDGEKGIHLSAFADILVMEEIQRKTYLRAIRFGGYPEMVQAMSDAIYGGGSIEVELPQGDVSTLADAKRFQRQISHDGQYAIATLLATDVESSAKSKDKASKSDDSNPTEDEANSDDVPDAKDAQVTPPRNSYIFCPKGDRDHLFHEIDRICAVPFIPEFQDYLLDELEKRAFLKPLIVHSSMEHLDAWSLTCHSGDSNIIAVIEDGLKGGHIAIPGIVTNPQGFEDVSSVTSYLNTFGVTVAERIRNQFTPLFDPANEPLSNEILAINDHIQSQVGYSLYGPQMAVAESLKRQLEQGKMGFVVAECGTGKTKIGATALGAFQHNFGKSKTFNVVLCPSHVAKKWVRELSETLPNTIGFVVHSITELDKIYDHYTQGDRSVYAVLSKEKARDGYMKGPAVTWDALYHTFRCPDCGKALEMPITDDGSTYMVTANQFFFMKERSNNRKCPQCNTPLWSAVNPDNSKSPWVKIGGYGWIFHPKAAEHLPFVKTETLRERIRAFMEQPRNLFKIRGACRRFPLSTYIKRQYKGKIDGLIVDEVHQFNNDSGQGDAMGELFQTANKVICMTATLINGYSAGIFHLLYRTMPRMMELDGQKHHKPQVFNQEYGVLETVYELKEQSYASNRRSQKVKKQSRLLPGVSPLVFTRFLLEHAAFLTLNDMGKDLPSYEEIPIALPMEQAVETEYKAIELALRELLKSDKRAAKKILSTYLNLLTIYPDQPYGQNPIVHPISGEVFITPKDTGDFQTLGAKEQKVLQLTQEKLSRGEKVLIYTSWTRTDSRLKLQKLLEAHQIPAEIMTDAISPDKREEWVEKQLSKGMQVLITNPSLVETGLDLNAFTTLIFYSMGYNLFTLRQASRRSWRINQTAPQVEVYLLYYENTMQAKAMKLMASKLAVAGIIEGNFSEEGLAAMSDVQDMTSIMAKELMQGIRDNVEDIAARFKRMAIINPYRIQSKPPELAVSAPVVITSVEPQHKLETVVAEPVVALVASQEIIQTRQKSKKPAILENQLSLFDFVA